MNEALEERERIKKYSWDDIRKIVEDEELSYLDMTYLAAISTHAVVIPLDKDLSALAGLKTTSVLVFLVADYPTGIYTSPGDSPIIIINESASVLDYDLVSELHPVHDSEIYLWLSEPWEDVDSDLGIHGEWYRSDVYPDGITPFDGETLGWADQPHTVEMGEDE